MKIVIAGAGKVGQLLTRELVDESQQVVLIEKDPAVLDRIINSVDIQGVEGNAASFEVLMEAGVETCDIFLAVTHEDEVNMIACIIAKRLGAHYTVARVRNPEYAEHTDFMRQEIGISMMINPELETAKRMADTIQYPAALEVDYFAQGRAIMLHLEVHEQSSVAGMSLVDFGQKYPDLLLTTIIRGDQVIVPSGQARILPNDSVYLIGESSAVQKMQKESGYRTKPIQSLLIIGGGRIAYYLMDLLTKMKVHVKVIERDLARAKELADAFPNVLVILGDGTDQDFLREERLDRFDAVATLTNIDEENMLTSIFAHKLGVPKIFTKVDRQGLLDLVDDSALQTIISPKNVIADEILHFVRSFSSTKVSNVERLVRIANNEVEVLQFLVKEDSQTCNQYLRDLPTKDNSLFAYILRGEDLIIPRGNDKILAGDHVIIVTTHKHFDDVDDILEGH